jgi:hypothetical protein
MPTLFARRYLRTTEDIGRAEKVLGLIILLLVLGVVAAFVFHVVTNRDYLFTVAEEAYGPAAAGSLAGDARAPVDVEREPAADAVTVATDPFPVPGLDDWRPPTEIDRFDPDTLYLKIDGQAPAYFHYGFVELVFGTYTHATDGDRTVDVYWYDMGNADNALAMYRAEEPPDATRVAIGREAYQVGGAVFFCKGASYVQVMPSGLDKEDALAALKIAERLAERITDN